MIASGAPAWAVWLALGLWIVALSLIALAVYAARAQWRRLKPTVLPMLQALGFAPLPMPQPDPRGVVVDDELVEVAPQLHRESCSKLRTDGQLKCDCR